MTVAAVAAGALVACGEDRPAAPTTPTSTERFHGAPGGGQFRPPLHLHQPEN